MDLLNVPMAGSFIDTVHQFNSSVSKVVDG